MEGWEEVDCFDKISSFEAIFFYHLLSEIEQVLLLSNLCKFAGSGNMVHWSTGLILPLEIIRNNPRRCCAVRSVKTAYVAQMCCPPFHHCLWETDQPSVGTGRHVVRFLLPKSSLESFGKKSYLLLQQEVILVEVPEI